MLILPALDILGGNCVRLAQGDYLREKVYDADPLSVARRFEDQGAKWIHVVDLDGAKSGDPANLHLASSIARETSLQVEFGGGVRSMETAHRLIDAGIARVVVGTAVIRDPELAEELFLQLGDKAVAGIDARDGRVATAGWTETSDEDAVSISLRVQHQGARRIILTDIARDGMLAGPNLELLQRIRREVAVPMIQSGGISSLEDIRSVIRLGKCAPEGIIIGRAIYEGRFTVAEALDVIALSKSM